MPPEAFEAAQRLIGAALLHSVWIGLAAASVAALLSSRLGSHRARHVLFLASLGVVAIGSPAAAIAQIMLRSRYEVPAIQTASVRLAIDRDHESSMAPPSPAIEAPRSDATAGWSDRFRIALDRAATGIQAASPYATALWAAGVVAAGAALSIGALRLRRLLQESRGEARLDGRARALARRLRLRRTPSVRVHPRMPAPCLAGVLRPAILIPDAWLKTATTPEIDAVLAHELAHARRLDHVANLMQRMIEACFFFHPCVHWLSRSARREAEPCADALAARLTGDPLALARALESVALFRPTSRRSLRLGLNLPVGGDRTTLLSRIQELLGMKPNRPRLSAWPFAGLPAALILAAVAASIGFAQEPKPPAPVDPPRPAAPKLDIPVEELRRLMRADPETLSRENLLKRLRNSGRGGTGLKDLSREELIKQAKAKMISYEVVFLEVDADAWERLGEGRLDQVPQTERDGAWLVKEADLAAILDGVATQDPTRTLRAPKVTCLEESKAHVSSGRRTPPIAGSRAPALDLLSASRVIVDFHEAFGPKQADGGFRGVLNGTTELGVKGQRTSNGQLLDVSVVSRLGTGVEPKEPIAGGEQRHEPSLSRGTVEVSQELKCQIPDGSGLVIDSGVCLVLGNKSVTNSTRTVRNLVAVMPRHVLEEAEEMAATERPEPRPTVEAKSK
ncbi:M56 family metallopeptidase [Paludisphaera soli]|uniref:M56 family metallopeptidase n=1 Tax=Paludisphaera soli TaxID=2712865 RepID=UPI0013ED2880|nr:M56 family metallopeptidase [Paludisphaera soli]